MSTAALGAADIPVPLTIQDPRPYLQLVNNLLNATDKTGRVIGYQFSTLVGPTAAGGAGATTTPATTTSVGAVPPHQRIVDELGREQTSSSFVPSLQVIKRS